MNRPDIDPEIAEQDEYGNTTIKEDGLCGSNFDDPNDPAAHGFENTPAECENEDCVCCPLDDEGKRKIDCPYVED